MSKKHNKEEQKKPEPTEASKKLAKGDVLVKVLQAEDKGLIGEVITIKKYYFDGLKKK